jgi:hypothetical protein
MPDDDSINKIIDVLQDAENYSCVHVLKMLRVDPTGDIRLLPYLEALLNNTSITVSGTSFYHGEVRWLAAQALAAEREASGIDESVVLYRVMKFMSQEEITAIAKDANMPSELSHLATTVKIKFLMEKGKMPLYDVEFLMDGRKRTLKAYDLE